MVGIERSDLKGRAVEMAERTPNIKRMMTGEELGLEGAKLPKGCEIESAPITNPEQEILAMIDDPKFRSAVECALNKCTNGNSVGAGG
ncbi:MAG: hypothetical protein IPM33_05225 [Phycisphaerales bacterium]|nr:hypothetical protein [Phycisphaerales bacterium]